MTTGESRWCIVLHDAGGQTEAGQGTDVPAGLERADLLAPRRRTVVAATWGTPRDSRWPQDVQYTTDVRPWAGGPLILHAAMRIACECPDAIVATLGPDHAVGDPMRYVAAVRQGAQWVSDHPAHVYALVAPTALVGPWNHDLAVRARPAHSTELPCGGWRPLATVARVDTLLRLLEVFQPWWWVAARERVVGANGADGAPPGWTRRLAPFDLMLDVLLRSPGHLRVRPVLPSMLERGPSPVPSGTWPRAACEGAQV